MNSDLERKKKIKEVCIEAFDLDPRDQESFLDQACAGDVELYREVASLLKHEHSVEGFLAQPAWQHVVRDMAIEHGESIAGRQLGRYQIHERIGEGGMGEVWSATDPQLKRDVAIKILPPEFSKDSERVQRFQQEAYAVSALKHPNIITIHEIGHLTEKLDDLHFIVTELVEGQTVRDRLARGPLGWREAVRIAAQIAGGLGAAHTAGLIHRDIKPENVIVQAGGHVKILDFGIAKWVGAPTIGAASDSAAGVQTRVGATPGTLKYMSPEQARGERLDPRTDVFSLGLVLYEMIAGRHPYGEMIEDRMIAALKSDDEIAAVRTEGHEVPAALDRILIRALRKNRDERYASASEMLTELNELKSLIEVSRQEKGQKLFRAQNANQLLTQFAVLYDVDKNTRIPLSALSTIWRFADEKRGPLEQETIRKSVFSGLAKVALLVLVVAAVTMVAAAAMSMNETWEERILRDGHTAAVRRAVFSPDGRLLVSGGEDSQVIVWGFARRERLKTLSEHKGRVTALAFSPDGKRLATGSSDQTVIVWDAAAFEKRAVLTGHKGDVGALAFSADGRFLASSSSDGPTTVWEVGQWRKMWDAAVGCAHCDVSFTPDGRQLLVSITGSARWDVMTGERIEDGLSSEEGGNGAALSPNGARMVTADAQGNVKFFDLVHGKLLGKRQAHHDHGRTVAYSPDGRLVATGGENIVLWDATTMQKVALLEHTAIVWSLAFSPDGRCLVSTHGDGAILVWGVAERERVANFNEHSGAVRAVAFSPDGRRIASASEDRSIIIWDVEHGTKEAVLTGHRTRVTGVAFSPDGKWIASCDQNNGGLICWDVNQRQPRWSNYSKKWLPSYCLAISSDGRFVVNSSGVYESAGGRPVLNFYDARLRHDPNWSQIYGAAFSANGRWLACVSPSGHLLLWETQQWQLSESPQFRDAPLISVSFSPDGKWLVTGDDQGKVRLWKTEPLRQEAILGQHSSRIKSVAFSPDGKQVASAGDDKMIALWDVSSRSLITRIGQHTAPVYAVTFSPDGRQLISGGHDRSVRLYTRHRTIWGLRLD